MTISSDKPMFVSAAKTTLKPISTAIMASLLFATFSAYAASEVTISQPVSGSTTIVEQSADGKVATITATPTGITMQDGVPFYVTQVTTVPRYSTPKANTTQVTTMPQGTTTVTTVPVTSAPLTSVPVTTTVPATASTTLISLDNLQLNPVFSMPDQVNANTKIMKVLKNSAGRDVAVPANHIAPGDIIEYHTTYSATSQPVSGLHATVSLPNGVKLVSLNSPLPTLATTGGDSYQTIQQVGNTVVVQENYSGLKWNLVNLAADAPQTVIIRAKVQ